MWPRSDENGVQPGCGCCGQYYYHSNPRSCICLPYVDRYMITAQIISIAAFLSSWIWLIPFIMYHFASFSISWIWWVAFIVGFICFLQLQVIWCCRRSKIGLYISAGHSAIAAVTCSIAAIVMIVVPSTAVGLIAFVTAILWFVTTGCIFYFVKSGRHTRWEEKLQASVTTTTTTTTTTVATTLLTTAIEMRTMHNNQDDSHDQQEQQSTIAVITASATDATSYVLPDILDKSDDV